MSEPARTGPGRHPRGAPDLKPHGFGLKLTALSSERVRQWLWSADSLAWSLAARRQGRDGDSWREAMRYAERVEARAA